MIQYRLRKQTFFSQELLTTMVTQVTTELFSNKTVLLDANNNSYYF